LIARSRKPSHHYCSRTKFLVAASTIACSIGSLGMAQVIQPSAPTNPVYLADAPVALETIERAMVLSAQGSHAEAARALSQLIIESGDRLIDNGMDTKVSIPVRLRIHSVIASQPKLLESYRRINTPKAQRLMDAEQWAQTRLQYWLTAPGCDASLNHAQMLLEDARFGGAIREITRLVDHPDASSRATRAIELLWIIYQASPSNSTLEQLEAWSKLAGIAMQSPAAFELPAQPTQEITTLRWSPIDQDAQEYRIEGLVPKPIASSFLTPPPASDELIGIDDAPSSGAVVQPKPWSMPVIMDDTLITNDGITISCFDRFTLRPRWRVTTNILDTEEQDRTSKGVRSRIARTVEDMSSVTIHDGIAYVAAGLARTGGRTGDNRILAIDVDGGGILKSTTLDLIDPELAGSTVRGSIIVDGDTLIIAARKNLRRERLVALSLVGIDRRTFEHKWTREIGSAGSLPFQQIGQISHSGMLSDGVVYWTDMIGLVCAVETTSGEVLWARTMPASDIYARYEREPWTVSTPIVRDEHVYILDVAGTRIDRINKDTGERTGSTRAMNTGQGLYLIETPTHLACINRTSITTHAFDQFGVSRPQLFTPTNDGRSPILGRVSSSGSTLIVPVSDGITLLDVAKPSERQSIALENSGNFIALDGQVVIADENEVHSFLSWDIARQLLSQRIESLNDTHASITLADLAYRSGNHDQIIPAIDQSIAMLRRSTTDPQKDARQRLFDILLEMISLPNAALRESEKLVSDQIRDQLLNRSSLVARTKSQTLAQQMVSGAWSTALGDIDEAVRIYHAVLHNESISSGMWQGGGLAIRADIEVTNQLNQIVTEHGRDACRVFDELALADLDALGQTASPDAYARVARMYPWAPTTPSAWSRSAKRWLQNDNAPSAVRAAQSGLESIDGLSKLGLPIDQTTLNDLGSLLVEGLIDSQRHSEASRVAARLSSTYPEITISVQGQPIDAGSLSIGLSSGQFAPQLAERFLQDPSPTLLTGSPVKSPIRTDYQTMVFFAPQLAQVRMMRFTDSNPELLWTRRSPDVHAPIVVVHNEFQTVLFWAPSGDDPDSGWIESIETTSGQTRWKIQNIGERLFASSTRVPDRAAQIDGQFASPNEGVVQLFQILSTSDGSVLAMIDRIGRAGAVDLLTGQVLWSEDLPINRVHDVDLSSGVLGVVGMWHVDNAPENGEVLHRSPRIASIDSRTGQIIQMMDAQTSTPRWVRVAPSGSLVVGTSQRVLSVSTRTGTLDWVIRNDNLMNTNAGWIIDDSLIVLDEYVNLFPIGLDDGKIPIDSFNTLGRVYERGWVDVQSRGEHLAIIASGGMGLFETSGQTLALDPEPTSRPYVDTAWGNDSVALVGRAASDGQRTMNVPIKLFSLKNARLMDTIELKLPSAIQRQPTISQAADGVVVVGFGEVSVLIRTE
jgi:outer membrane protein assembly factor BamB